MRVTIIVDDNIVIFQGQAESVDCSGLISQDIHAVQWYDTWGEIEFATDFQTGTRKPSAKISDFSSFQPYVEAWENAAKRPAPVTQSPPPLPPPPAIG